MSKLINGITNTQSQSIDTLVSVVNAIAAAVSSEVVTVNSSSSGATTVGNGFVSGILGASVVVGTQFRGGMVNSSSNAVFISNVEVQPGLTVGLGNSSVFTLLTQNNVTTPSANVAVGRVSYFNQSNLSFSNTVITDLVVTTNSSPTQVFDSFGVNLYRTAEYLLQITDNAANNYTVSKLMLVQDGTNVVFTEYGIMGTNAAVLATWSATTNSTSVVLSVSPLSSNLTIRAVRTTMKP